MFLLAQTKWKSTGCPRSKIPERNAYISFNFWVTAKSFEMGKFQKYTFFLAKNFQNFQNASKFRIQIAEWCRFPVALQTWPVWYYNVWSSIFFNRFLDLWYFDRNSEEYRKQILYHNIRTLHKPVQVFCGIIEVCNIGSS